MGEPQPVIAEPDELEGEADIDGLHPPTLQQHNPWFISIILNFVISVMVTFGWYALAFLLIVYILWWYMEPKVQHWQRIREQNRAAAEYHKNPDRALAKERAVNKARQRMQEEYNLKVLDQAKERELEEKNKQEHKDSHNKNTTGESSLSSAATGTNSSAKPSGKPRLRPEYSPLTGDTGSRFCGWRGSQRGISGGG